MAKRCNGEGSIHFVESKNIWRAMFTTPAGNRLTKSSKDEAVVRDWFNEQKLLIGRNQHIEPTGITLGKWMDEWLEVYAKANTRPRTYDRYVSLLDHADSLRNIKLVNLLPSHFQKLYNELKDLSGTTKKKIHYCLSGCLKQAVKNRLIYGNPLVGVDVPKASTQEIEILTGEEIEALHKAAEKDRYSIIVPLAANTGMRISEILGLKWADIDFKKSTISIKRTVHYSLSIGVHEEEPKTDRSKRIIRIDTSTMLKLKEYKLKSGTTDWIFVTKLNNLVSPHTYLRWHFTPIREAAGVTKGFHSFRHTHATELLAAGVPILDVSKRLGHSKPSTTLNIYGHVLDQNEDKIMQVLENKKSLLN